MKQTVPVFIVGSGRNGTRMLYKLFSGVKDVESHHQYQWEQIQPIITKYCMGLFSRSDIKNALKKIHGSAIYYSEENLWINSCNKMSWVIEPLYELFPQAKFIHVVRDGRKVVSSFFHKLKPEIYEDRCVSILSNWLNDPKTYPEPPPEERYWWNIPQKGQPFYKEFPSYNQFQRICYHWSEVTRVISESFINIPKTQTLTITLEDLVGKEKVLQQLYRFIDIPYVSEYFQIAQKPENVFFPMDLHMNAEEIKQFSAICGKRMKEFGYAKKKEYSVKY